MAEVSRGVIGDEEYVVGQELDNGSVVTLIDVEEYEDGSQQQVMEATHASGAVDRTTTFSPAAAHPVAIEAALHQKLIDAMVDNVTVLAELDQPGASPEATRAQVVELTRQFNALARVVLRRFNDSAGT